MKYYVDNATNEIYAYKADGSQDDFIKDGLTLVTDAEVATLRSQKEQDRLDSLTYAEKRVETYPSIGEQLDMIYHAGLGGDEFQAAIKAVKDKHPKP